MNLRYIYMNSIESNTFPENDYRYYLIHHGIKGQKWGKRSAPWYPISDYQAHLKRTGGNSKSAKMLNDIAKDIERVYRKDFNSIKKLEDYQESKNYDPEVAEEMSSKMFAKERRKSSSFDFVGLDFGTRGAIGALLNRNISAYDGKDFGFEIPKPGSKTVKVDFGGETYELKLGDFNKEVAKRGLDKDWFFEESISAVRNSLSTQQPSAKINSKQGVSEGSETSTKYKHSKQERDIAAKVRANGYSSLSDTEKEIFDKAYK